MTQVGQALIEIQRYRKVDPGLDAGFRQVLMESVSLMAANHEPVAAAVDSVYFDGQLAEGAATGYPGRSAR